MLHFQRFTAFLFTQRPRGMPMTYSLIALDADTNTLGVACATGGPALGGFVPHLLPGVGAAITQGFSTHVMAAEQGLARLAQGMEVENVIAQLRHHDQGEAWRQIAIMDIHGQSAGWTGEQNVPKVGMHLSTGLVVAGNMLANDLVIPAMVDAFQQHQYSEGLAHALLAALLAAQSAGGDQRGTRSAAIKMRAPGGLPLDLRVDDAPSAATELAKLYHRVQNNEEYQTFLQRLPTASHPHRH